jgi:uncharacterized protein (UPF0264 family)
MSVRSRFKAGKGLLAWLVRHRRKVAAFALDVAATVREARKGPDTFTRAAEDGADYLRVGQAARDYGVPADMPKGER